MKRCDTWRADSIRFAVSGRGAQHFLSAAAARRVRLENIRCTGTGYEATAAGAEVTVLRELADKGGWEMTVRTRRGPGHFVERLLARPGVVPIPRTGRAAHTVENADAARLRLTAEELTALDAAFPPPTRKLPLDMQ